MTRITEHFRDPVGIRRDDRRAVFRHARFVLTFLADDPERSTSRGVNHRGAGAICASARIILIHASPATALRAGYTRRHTNHES